tara:strand:+ start:3409 stop:3933 length:525 start_codon:yes stop_codon:yes gene_type:complete
MKQYLLLSFSLFLFGSCRNVEPELNFYLSTSGQYSIPTNTVVNVALSDTITNLETNSATTFSNNNTSADLITEVSLSSLSLELLNPADGNFNFIESITVYINAEGLAEKQIANLVDPDPNVRQIFLQINGTDLQDYLKKAQYDMRVVTITKAFLFNAVDIELNSRFLVKAKPRE